MIEIVKVIAVLVAAVLVGNWYMAEAKEKRAKGEPWYSAYLSLPGLIVIAVIIVVPLVIWFLNR